MQRVLLLSLVLASVLGTAGCLHIKAELPGTLDLRSDGADAPTRKDNMSGDAANRDGFGGFIYGAGASGTTDVVIEDRQHYVLAWFPILNHATGAGDEYQAAIGKEALRNVRIGEELSIMNVANNCLFGLIPAVGGLVSSSFDFKGSATRISTGGGGDVSIPPPPPSDPSTSGTGY